MIGWQRCLLLLTTLVAVATSGVRAEDAAVSHEVLNDVHGDEELPASQVLQAKTNHILVATKEEADAVVAELLESDRILRDFARIAIAKSLCEETSKRGGTFGWVPRGKLVPELDAVVFDREPAQLYTLQTARGWHVVYTIVLRVGGADAAQEEAVEHTLRVYLYSFMPYLGPIIVIGAMFWGQANSSRLNGPRAQASHILVATEAEADDLLKQVREAQDPKKKIAELAAIKSKCPSKKKGGDLGMFGRGQMVPAFEKIAFENEVGTVHKVETQFGWHVILVVDHLGVKLKKNN